ncbi:MAG TPA: hypothetical protein VH054_21210, partial [Polyangiaceae bacterium]|nr:hypothetical protein [Polyangiaceae bacterium]
MPGTYHTLLHTRAARASGTITGVECKQEPGEFAPIVDRAKCEGKSDCARVCPYDVFEVRRIDDADYDALAF